MNWKRMSVLIAGILSLSVFSFVVFLIPEKQEEGTAIHGDSDDFFDQLHENMEDESTSGFEGNDEQEQGIVVVDVKGEVNSPGVYQLANGMRVVDAIEKAGGLTEKGEQNNVNFAEKLRDEMVIFVPGEGEEGEAQVPLVNTNNASERVRINYADAAELQMLPGIGPAKANAIITYREENGLFTNIEAITEVSGIGEKSFEQLEEKITID